MWHTNARGRRLPRAATPPGGAWRRAFRGGARCALRTLSRRRAVRFDSIRHVPQRNGLDHNSR